MDFERRSINVFFSGKGYDHDFDARPPRTGLRGHGPVCTFAGGAALSGSEAQRVSHLVRINLSAETYQCDMAGNVAVGNQPYFTAGTYRDTFDFARRGGSVEATFDGRSLASKSFAGSDAAAGEETLTCVCSADLGDTGLTGELNGRFVGSATRMLDGDFAPAAIVGAFTITDPMDGYSAIGTFAG